MFISIKLLHHPGTVDIQLEVSPQEKIHEIKTRLAQRINIPTDQQKLVFKGKPLQDGSLEDYQIIDGAKLHLIVTSQQSTSVPVKNSLSKELRLLASKWMKNPDECEEFIATFQIEMKNIIDRLSLDDIEKLCTDRLNQTV